MSDYQDRGTLQEFRRDRPDYIAIRIASDYRRFGPPGCTEQDHINCVWDNFCDYFLSREQFDDELAAYQLKLRRAR